jgi:hypothetical protein
MMCDLIRQMGRDNPLWGAPRIHGELLMLGFGVAQSTVSKYMVRGRRPPSQSWKTFLQNRADAIAAIDMCVVPTLSFERLFVFVVLGHGRRQLLWVRGDTASDGRVAGAPNHRRRPTAAGSSGPTIRKHCRYARSVGAASSLRADMISGKDNGVRRGGQIRATKKAGKFRLRHYPMGCCRI